MQKKREKRTNALVTTTVILIIIFLCALLITLLLYEKKEKRTPMTTGSSGIVTAVIPNLEEIKLLTADLPPDPFNLTETEIYTFMQGPVAYSSGTDWGGSWCDMVLFDQKFSVFGCGLCCLANIYSTLTPYDCSPIDMFEYAREVSDYTPVSGYGAIDWPHMKYTLETLGIESELHHKDENYSDFQDALENNITATVLISSAYDKTYWQHVPGHYINVWNYDRTDDTVFLADSGNPEHNRQRIPLKYVYDAINTGSTYQYLLVTGVDPDKNTWKHDGIDIEWNVPAYYE